MLAGVENFLSSPVLHDYVSYDDLTRIWQRARLINFLMLKHQIRPFGSAEEKARESKLIVQCAEEVIGVAAKVISDIKRATSALKTL